MPSASTKRPIPPYRACRAPRSRNIKPVWTTFNLRTASRSIFLLTTFCVGLASASNHLSSTPSASSLPASRANTPDTSSTDRHSEKSYRAFFARQPRHLFGCGIIWAEWRWAGKRSKWDFDGRCMDMIKAMGGTSVPINIPWFDVEREEGSWNFDYADHQVAEAEARGLAMFAYMGLTPDWALPPKAPPNKSGIGFRFPPPENRQEQFTTYCHKVAERYKGRIRYYQFWNEPNGCSWVNDGCANGHVSPETTGLYTRWLKRWYTAMKQVDPDCVLAVGGLDYHEGVQGHHYLEGLYAEGAQDYFDAIAIHPYGVKTPLYYKAIEDTRRIMVAHGDGYKGIWLREYGWALDDEKEKSRRITETLQQFANPKYYYVTMATYLSLTDPGGVVKFGLCDNDLKPRKSYHAFQQVARDHRQSVPASAR